MASTLVAPERSSVVEGKRQSVPGPRLPHERFAFIDALRGLAALAVACHHIDRFGPLCDAVWRIEPFWISEILENARVGVRVFFVISGFVIAYSVRKAWVTPAYLGNFALRRSIRLEPPYWVTIAIVLTLNQLAGWLAFEPPGNDPSFLQILAHIIYVQEIAGYDHISVGFWTLCIELQFYLLFVCLLGVAQRLPQALARFGSFSTATGIAIVFLPLALWSLFGASLADEAWNASWVTRYFWAFFLGALVCWTLDGQTPRSLLGVYLAAMVGRLGYHFTVDAAVALATGLAIYGTGILGRLGSWLNWNWLQYLGRISYSLYLIHYPVSHLVSHFGYWLTDDSSAFGVLWMFVSLGLSVAAAHLLYIGIEAPSVRLSRRFRFNAAERSEVQPQTSNSPALQF
jgi:peptidoglycan/LPS O-acetylase OafA/YrhL